MSPELNKPITKKDPVKSNHSPITITELIQMLHDSTDNQDLLLTFLAELARSATSLTTEDVKKLQVEIEKSGIKINQE